MADLIFLNTCGRTMGVSFRQVTILPIAEPPNLLGSIVLMASRTIRNDLMRDPERNLDYSPEWRYGPEYQKAHAWDNHFSLSTEAGRVQKDADNSWDQIIAALLSAERPPQYYP